MDPKGYIATKTLPFNYNLKEAPRGTKMILLTSGGVACWGHVTQDPRKDAGIWAWSPMPCRDREKEEELGLTSLPKGFAAHPEVKDETNAVDSSVTNDLNEIEIEITFPDANVCGDGYPSVTVNDSARDVLPQRGDQLPEVRQQLEPSATSASGTDTGPFCSLHLCSQCGFLVNCGCICVRQTTAGPSSVQLPRSDT